MGEGVKLSYKYKEEGVMAIYDTPPIKVVKKASNKR
jgi:hypothetical protein